MLPYEPTPLDDILSGKEINPFFNPKAAVDLSQTLTPESILGEIRGANPFTEIQPDALPDYNELINEYEIVPEPEQQSKTTSPEPITAPTISTPTISTPASSETQTLDESEKETTDDSSSLMTVLSSVSQIEIKMTSIADASVKIVGEVRDMHKLYHNEFANRLKSMQDELERYREVDRGRIFDGILGEVAKLYSDNESVLDYITDAKVAKRIRYLLMDIVQILEGYGVQLQKSKSGDKRNARLCQIIERIPASNPDQHDTVAKSRSTGFSIGNRVLIKELVDVYLYSEKTDEQSGEN